MPTITFRAKIETIYNMDGSPAYRRVKVPAVERRHCDIQAFRDHPKFRGFVNSDLFKGLLRRQLALAGVKEHLRLDHLPACAAVDESGFLAVVTLTIGEG